MREKKHFLKSDNTGFSMVELITVTAIMVIIISVLAPQFMKYVEKSRVSADCDALEQIFDALSYEYLTGDYTPGELSSKYFNGVGSGGELPASGISILQINSNGQVSLTYNTNFEEHEYLYEALGAAGLDVQTLKAGGSISLFRSSALRQAVRSGGSSVMMRLDTRQILCMWVGSPADSDGTLSASCLPDEQFAFGDFNYK